MFSDLLVVNVAILWTLFGGIGALIAASLNRSAVNGCFWGLLGGPLAWIVYALVGPRGNRCSECDELVRPAARICPHCGTEFAAAPRSGREPERKTPGGEPRRWGRLSGGERD